MNEATTAALARIRELNVDGRYDDAIEQIESEECDAGIVEFVGSAVEPLEERRARLEELLAHPACTLSDAAELREHIEQIDEALHLVCEFVDNPLVYLTPKAA